MPTKREKHENHPNRIKGKGFSGFMNMITGKRGVIAANYGKPYLNAGMHSGLVNEDYYRNRPGVMGKVKMKDFAKEFAAAIGN